MPLPHPQPPELLPVRIEPSHHAINHVFAVVAEPGGKIAQEVTHDGLVLVATTPGGVRRDVTAGRRPKRVGWRKGLGLENIETGGGKPARLERVDERPVINRRSAPDVVELGARLAAGEAAGVNVVARGLVVGEEVHDVVGAGKRGAETLLGNDMHAGFAAGAAAHGDYPHAKGREQLGEAAGNHPIAEEENGLAVEQARFAAKLEVAPRAVGKLPGVRARKLAPEREHHGEDVLRARLGKNARGVCENAVARAEGVPKILPIIARVTGGGGLYPAERGERHALPGVGLPERDAGAFEKRVGTRRVENRGGQVSRKNKAAVAGARAVLKQAGGGC